MTTIGLAPQPCAEDIYKHGTPFLLLGQWDGGARDLEEWCKRVASESGQRVDWHFYAGRALFKVIGDKGAAMNAASLMLDQVGCGRAYMWQ